MCLSIRLFVCLLSLRTMEHIFQGRSNDNRIERIISHNLKSGLLCSEADRRSHWRLVDGATGPHYRSELRARLVRNLAIACRRRRRRRRLLWATASNLQRLRRRRPKLAAKLVVELARWASPLLQHYCRCECVCPLARPRPTLNFHHCNSCFHRRAPP